MPRITAKNHPQYRYAEFYDGDCFDENVSDVANDDCEQDTPPEGHWDVEYWDDDEDDDEN